MLTLSMTSLKGHYVIIDRAARGGKQASDTAPAGGAVAEVQMSLMMRVTPRLERMIEEVKLHNEKRTESAKDPNGYVKWYDERAELYEEIGEVVYQTLKDLPF